MKSLELIVNAQCDKSVTLCRIRSVDGTPANNLPTIRFQADSNFKNLCKGDGVVISVDGLVQKGNYLQASSYKVVDTHITGKAFDLDAAMAPEEPIF